ncbi:MAG TPA: RpiB/LacA/LacB family sugar-phosphate isomerase [Candidatus Nitrosotenuis sp.]|jgi:ribose 5-phosphate isomerase B|nr:RpiB/LacA/LacB family sugar-phosphate isomerase [Candidatus Nitrosotenuis sp.]
MKIVIASDERCELTTALIAEVKSYGHEIILLGALNSANLDTDWPICCGQAAQYVAQGQADEGIACCWTGTGASIIANKVPGIRAALCQDRETAKGARIWNHANVLALSLRSTSIPVMKEIIGTWFETSPLHPDGQTEWNLKQLAYLKIFEKQFKNGSIET